MDVIKVRKYWDKNSSFKDWDDMSVWLLIHFGMSGRDYNWDYDTTHEYMDLFFKNQTDAELFILKWI